MITAKPNSAVASHFVKPEKGKEKEYEGFGH